MAIMAAPLTLTASFPAAMQHARYEQLPAGSDYGDGQWYGSIPLCLGVWAVGATRDLTYAELESSLADWALLGLQPGHPLPVVDGINLAVQASPQ